MLHCIVNCNVCMFLLWLPYGVINYNNMSVCLSVLFVPFESRDLESSFYGENSEQAKQPMLSHTKLAYSRQLVIF